MKDQPEPPDRSGKRRSGRVPVPGVPGTRTRRLQLAVLAAGAGVVIAGASVAAFSSPGQPGYLSGQSKTSPTTAVSFAAKPASHGTSGHADAAPQGATTPRSTRMRGAGSQGPRPRRAGPQGATSKGVGDTSGKTVLRWPRGLKSQIVRWNTGSGGAALSAVTGQLGNVMQDVAVGLYPKARLSCARLESSVGNARAAPPIPDAAMEHLYREALDGISDAVTYCRYALSAQQLDKEDESVSVNKALLSQSMVKFATASNLLYTATGEIRPLHR